MVLGRGTALFVFFFTDYTPPKGSSGQHLEIWNAALIFCVFYVQISHHRREQRPASRNLDRGTDFLCVLCSDFTPPKGAAASISKEDLILGLREPIAHPLLTQFRRVQYRNLKISDLSFLCSQQQIHKGVFNGQDFVFYYFYCK